CEDNPFSVMGCSNADLSFGGCAANLQRRLQGGRNRGYENKSGSVVGSCSVNGDSSCHEFPLADLELSCESLDKHHCSHNLFFGFNLIGLPRYPSAYDRFLIIVGLAFNVLTIWYAWQ